MDRQTSGFRNYFSGSNRNKQKRPHSKSKSQSFPLFGACECTCGKKNKTKKRMDKGHRPREREVGRGEVRREGSGKKPAPRLSCKSPAQRAGCGDCRIPGTTPAHAHTFCFVVCLSVYTEGESSEREILGGGYIWRALLQSFSARSEWTSRYRAKSPRYIQL